MILLELHGNKELKTRKKHRLFIDENNMDSVYIQLMDDKIGDQDVDDCEFSLHVVLPDQSYFEYELEFGEDDIASVPITSDWTGSAQKLKLYVEITADNEVLGSTNRVEIMVEHIVNEAIRLLNRDELIDFFNNVTAGKQNYVNLGTNNNTNVFDNNTDYKTLYAVTHNSVGYIFYSLQHSSIQYRFSGNGIEARSTSESTWINLTQNRAEHVSLGTNNNTNVFDNNTDYKKLYSVTHNSVGYLFFILKDTTIQYRFSGNGIEVRSTSESTWTNLTDRDTTPTENSTKLITSGAVFAALASKMNFVELPSSSSADTFNNNTAVGTLYRGYVVDNEYFWIALSSSGIALFQYRFSTNGIELREYGINGWSAFKNIVADKYGYYSDTTNTKSLSDLNAMTDVNKVYFVALKSNILYQGQSAGTMVKIDNVRYGQYLRDDEGNIYFRSYSTVTQTWSSITTIVSNT